MFALFLLICYIVSFFLRNFVPALSPEVQSRDKKLSLGGQSFVPNYEPFKQNKLWQKRQYSHH